MFLNCDTSVLHTDDPAFQYEALSLCLKTFTNLKVLCIAIDVVTSLANGVDPMDCGATIHRLQGVEERIEDLSLIGAIYHCTALGNAVSGMNASCTTPTIWLRSTPSEALGLTSRSHVIQVSVTETGAASTMIRCSSNWSKSLNRSARTI